MFDNRISNINANKLSSTIFANQKKFRNEQNLNALYCGIVEDTNDPFNMGRVKVRIPRLHGTQEGQHNYLSTRDIPWASPALLNGGTNDMGQMIVPVKGSTVTVSFQYDDFNQPMYFGSVPTKINNKKIYNDNPNIFNGEPIDITTDDDIKDLSRDTAKTVVYKSIKGSTIIIDDKDGKETIRMIDAAGQVFEMGNNSKSALKRRGNREVPPKSSSTYMSLRNNLGDEIAIMSGDISIITSNGEEILLSEGEVTVTSGDNTISLTEDEAIVSVGDNTISLTEDEALVTTGNSNVSIKDGDVSFSDGESSISLSGGTCTFNTTNFILNAANTNIGDYVTK